MKTTTLATIDTLKSRQRRRTEETAIKFLIHHLGSRTNTLLRNRVRLATQPIREAKRVIAEEQNRDDPSLSQMASAKCFFDQVNDVTWKLTDGVMSEREGRLDPGLTRALGWISGHGWGLDSTNKEYSKPTKWTAHGMNGEIWEADNLSEAKKAVLSMHQGLFHEFAKKNRRES